MTDGAGFGPVAGGAPVPTPAATGVPGRHELEEQVLGEVTPTRKEEESLQADAKDLLRLADARLAQLEVPGRATLQGSAAKGTWLRGGGDLDVFLLLQPDVPEARLDAIAGEVGQGLLEGAHRKYAQHPYLVGSFRGRAVDLVPAYDVGSAAERRSAVDRTPLHTRWVREHLDARLAGDVRLAKRWLKGIGAYGADTATAGFSGYLVEVLLVWSGSFAAFLRYLAGGSRPRRLALGEDRLRDDTPAALRVVDPVDPERNCAAAVSEATLQLAAQAAAQYLQRPDRRYYFPRPP
ncbi:MAG TPA: nucleotidyltransferase domain-containing protein, partial [Candidatus Thermoplasmatota archaeon]|nr:nucleotidyltransferase domain-containing protein [Candidatus Thermoplasmatota archaeon]